MTPDEANQTLWTISDEFQRSGGASLALAVQYHAVLPEAWAAATCNHAMHQMAYVLGLRRSNERVFCQGDCYTRRCPACCRAVRERWPTVSVAMGARNAV